MYGLGSFISFFSHVVVKVVFDIGFFSSRLVSLMVALSQQVIRQEGLELGGGALHSQVTPGTGGRAAATTARRSRRAPAPHGVGWLWDTGQAGRSGPA